MFGLSFGELCVLLVVAMVVLGPKELPRYLRKAGQLAGRLRRLAYEMREKSGIDEVLRAEGIDREIAEIRKLARGELGGVVAAVRSANDAVRDAQQPAGSPYDAGLAGRPAEPVTISRDREYPREGVDSYGALPDTAVVYDGALAPSPLAESALYAGSGAPATGPAEPPATGAAEASVPGPSASSATSPADAPRASTP